MELGVECDYKFQELKYKDEDKDEGEIYSDDEYELEISSQSQSSQCSQCCPCPQCSEDPKCTQCSEDLKCSLNNIEDEDEDEYEGDIPSEGSQCSQCSQCSPNNIEDIIERLVEEEKEEIAEINLSYVKNIIDIKNSEDMIFFTDTMINCLLEQIKCLRDPIFPMKCYDIKKKEEFEITCNADYERSKMYEESDINIRRLDRMIKCMTFFGNLAKYKEITQPEIEAFLKAFSDINEFDQ